MCVEHGDNCDYWSKMVPFVFLILAAANVDGQLEFTASQRGPIVNINCTLKDIHDTSLSLIISMLISRLTGTDEEILASVSSVGSMPVTHSGIVTSNISMDGSHESFVNIEWTSANNSLEGDYVCKLTGLDNNNSPTVLSETLKLDLEDPGPGVKATPAEIQVGLTPLLTIRCFVSDLTALNISKLTSIDMSHVHAGIDQLLATISIFEDIVIKPGSEIISVDGFLGKVEIQENFLEASWQDPGLNRTGRYECTFSGQDTEGAPVQFESSYDLNIVVPSIESLTEQLRELQNKFDTMSEENKELASERDQITGRILVLEESLKGHKLCDSVDLPVGQYPITLFPDDGLGLLSVLCDVVGPGDAWTVFQKRYNGAENFDRDFTSYNNGFGSVHAEHWLGLRTVKRLMTGGTYQLRIDITDYKGINYTRIYPKFDLGPSDGYQLTADGYNDGGHGMSFSSGAEFSTVDHGPQSHCAIQDNGGWWYDNCAFSNLNGKWGHSGESGVSWFEIPDGRTEPLKATEMKFQKSTLP